MSTQQTVLRVKTNKPSPISVTGTTTITVTGNTTGFTYSGTGTVDDPYMGNFSNDSSILNVNVSGNGRLYFDLNFTDVGLSGNSLQVFIQHAGDPTVRRVLTTCVTSYQDYFNVRNGDIIQFKKVINTASPNTYSIYVIPDVTLTDETGDVFEILDLYTDIPIKINKSFAELQDISKKNSDYSLGLKLPGSKKNNRFFENFFDVDNSSLFFDVTRKVQCNVLINDESFFEGYLRLNSISVQNSKVEYDTTIYSSVADLFGAIGNNLLKDLNFRDPDYFFNHTMNRDNVLMNWRYETLKSPYEVPSNYFYPIAHNGYNYETVGSRSVVLTGDTTGSTVGTNYYTTTKLGSWANNSAAYSAGVARGHINSPQDGIYDNQLKPALNVYSLLQLIFKTYGFKIKSDFMTSPWMKLLYLYGYFSDNSTKLSYTAPPLETFGASQVDLVYTQTGDTNITMYTVKAGTGTPCLCSEPISGVITILNSIAGFTISQAFTYPANSPLYGINWTAGNTLYRVSANTGISNRPLNYLPSQTGQTVNVSDGDYIDFSLVIDQDIKQIDFISSIAKKFNLVFVASKNNPFEIIIEPYQYYIGSGNIYDWTDKLSYDKGFTVEPAQNFIESELHLTDKEDGDAANFEFKKATNRIYGRNKIPNPTQFKSSEKKIETIFSPQLIRQWNPTTLTGVTNDVGIPLMINYAESSQEVDGGVNWTYSGVKTNPRLIYNLGNFSPFLNEYKETFDITGATTSYFRVMSSDATSNDGSLISPVVSHTMPIGNPDSNKINNDSISILFNGETQIDLAGQSLQILGSGSTLNVFTEQNVYNLFYFNRVQNAFDRNTRFISGYFDLSIRDIDKLDAKDLIKIKDQYFTWNKIENYNLTSPELTKVELVQSIFEVSEYPRRYFNYQYCSGDTTTYKFSTEFIGADSIYESLYYWSILYDNFIGTLGGQGVTGFTSSFPYTGNTYTPYSMWEVTKADYETSGTLYINDPQVNYSILNQEYVAGNSVYNSKNQIWLINSGQTKATLNLFTGCTDFNIKASEIGVRTSSTITGSTFTTGITLNVTDTGYIIYTTQLGQQTVYVSNTGTYVIPDCAECLSVSSPLVFSDPATFTITTCGNSC